MVKSSLFHFHLHILHDDSITDGNRKKETTTTKITILIFIVAHSCKEKPDPIILTCKSYHF